MEDGREKQRGEKNCFDFDRLSRWVGKWRWVSGSGSVESERDTYVV